ncbi:hypothetical protein GCM10017673_04830 [Streptosporangium violaceochromogenes]|nr:hypothetical protein GCM10017673_04830 [Streptosporangium violaceochromogenes]
MSNLLPQRVVVVGGGGGGLTIACELSLAGVEVTVADLPEFAGNLAPVAERGGLDMQWRTSPSDATSPSSFVAIHTISTDPVTAVQGAPLVIVCVPSYGHRRFAELLAPALTEGQTVVWVGEGGGAFSAVAASRSAGTRGVVHAETNSLPYGGAFIKGPGQVGATRKRGGTVVAALPAAATPKVAALAAEIWPWVTPAENAWEALLLNFNAIDHVPTMICNLGRIEGEGTYRIWGEGGSPGVAAVIKAVDQEYLALRGALGLSSRKGWEDYLVDQGMAPEKGATTYDTIQSSILAAVQFACGPKALEHRFVAEDVPYALVLARSIGDELNVDTPVIDGLIAIGSAASGIDYGARGRTLADWGLSGAGSAGLRAAAEEGWW